MRVLRILPVLVSTTSIQLSSNNKFPLSFGNYPPSASMLMFQMMLSLLWRCMAGMWHRHRQGLWASNSGRILVGITGKSTGMANPDGCLNIFLKNLLSNKVSIVEDKITGEKQRIHVILCGHLTLTVPEDKSPPYNFNSINKSHLLWFFSKKNTGTQRL